MAKSKDIAENRKKLKQGSSGNLGSATVDIGLCLTPLEIALLVRAISVGRAVESEFSVEERQILKSLAKRLDGRENE